MKNKFNCHLNIKSANHKIIISQDIIRDIESLPNKQNNRKIEFEEWEDKLLIQYGGKKSLTQIAQMLGKKKTTVFKRYRELCKR